MASGRENEQSDDQLEFDDETLGVTEDEAAERYSFTDTTIKQLEGMGFADRGNRPVLEPEHARIFRGLNEGDYFDGRMPVVLKSLSLDDLSGLYSLFSSWYAYVAQKLTMISIERSESQAVKEATWSMVRMKHLKYARRIGVNLSDQRQSDLARYDKRFVEANRRFLALDALYDSVRAIQSIAEKDMDVISRNITVRDVQINAEARGRGFGSGPSRFDGYRGTPAQMPVSDTVRKGTPPHAEARKEDEEQPASGPKKLPLGSGKKPINIRRSFIGGPKKAKRD